MSRSRYTDYTGVENTCPKIDEVISFINSIVIPEDSYHSKEDIIAIMERIRESNVELRNFGNQNYRELGEVETERNSLLNENKDLKSDIEDLKIEIEELEDRDRDSKDELCFHD